MKNMSKRIFAGILVVALVLSLAAGLLVSVNAVAINYVTGNPVPYESGDDSYYNVIANWGERGDVATYLSDNAIDFYSAGNSYADIKGLADTNESTEYNDGLYDALHDLMAENHLNQTDYDSTRALFAYTDCQGSDYASSGAISCFYTGKALGPAWDMGATWNREHTWPNSKGMNGDDENDIMMLRPTDSGTNSGRNNKAYGESSGYYDPNEASNGAFNVRGDAARIILYTYVRWGNTNINDTGDIWGTTGVMESVDVLLRWMQEDPVDTWELGRNDSVESITGTRNVFVDYPELGFLLFNEEVPDMQTPSGEAAAQDSSYSVTAVSGDQDLGTVTCSRNTITAFPVRGYQASGWEIISGSATVTQNGNVFTVDPSSDCTVKIYFQPAASDLITFKENGIIQSQERVYDGEYLTMPQCTGSVPVGYTFLGWTESNVNHSSDKPAQVYAPGERYTPTDDTVFFALYQYTVDDPSGDSDVFEKHTGAVVPGHYLIVSNGAAMSATINKERFTLDTGITVAGTQVTGAAETSIWTFEQISGNTFSIYNSAAGRYASATGTGGKVKLVSSVEDDYAKWQVTTTEDPYVIENVGNRDVKKINQHVLRRNADYGFSAYVSTTGTGISLYKQASGKAVYTTTESALLRGDMNSDGTVDDADALYLLRNNLFPDRFPITQSGDVNGDGTADDADALYLLRFTLFPERFPLSE